MLEVRVIFDALIRQYPTLDSHIGSNSAIIHSPNFEKGLVALQRGVTDNLDPSLNIFEATNNPGREELVEGESMVMQALRNSRNLTHGRFVNTSGVCPTSNHLERLFSQCKLIRNQLGRAMLPSTLEMIIFLKVNAKYWNVQDVEQALNSWTGQDLLVIDEDLE